MFICMKLFYLEQFCAYIKLSLSLVGRQEVMFLLLGLRWIIQPAQPFAKLLFHVFSLILLTAEEIGITGNIQHVIGACPATESLLLKGGR